MYGIGTVLGPFIGGAFASSKLGWRWVFYINLPVGAVITPLLIFLIPSCDRQKGMSNWERLASVDWIGSALLSGTIVPLIVAITLGGNMFPWESGQIIGLFVLFGFNSLKTLLIIGISLIGFIFSQTLHMPWQSKERRLFPVELLFSRTTVLLFILNVTAGASMSITLYYIPLYFQFTRVSN